jgi:hypothetical protein
MTTSATHGTRNGIGSAVQPGTDASNDGCKLLSQPIGGAAGLNFLARGKGVFEFFRAKLAQPATKCYCSSHCNKRNGARTYSARSSRSSMTF